MGIYVVIGLLIFFSFFNFLLKKMGKLEEEIKKEKEDSIGFDFQKEVEPKSFITNTQYKKEIDNIRVDISRNKEVFAKVEEEDDGVIQLDDFDIRKAVIFSEIINNPYIEKYDEIF